MSLSPATELPPQASPFSELYSDYFGVRNGARNSTEPVTEQQIISLVQEMEKKFSHSVSLFFESEKISGLEKTFLEFMEIFSSNIWIF